MHQGTIEAHSGGIGQGSVFTVRLPLMTDDTRVEPPAEHIRNIDTNGALDILVVDDNRDAAESLAILLRSYGHRVETAFSGSEALELASRVRADIAFLDIGMPHMDGHELARRLRQRKDVQPVLVALTGWGQHADRQRSAAAGFDHHVVKPMEPQRLAQLLEAAGRRGRR
jgi:CheY-like chemotaxis protein